MLTLLQAGSKHKQCLTPSAALSWVQDFETVTLLKYDARLFSGNLPIDIKEKEREREMEKRKMCPEKVSKIASEQGLLEIVHSNHLNFGYVTPPQCSVVVNFF